MLYFDLVHPVIIYIGIWAAFLFCFYAIFHKKQYINKHKNTIFNVAIVLLAWTQIARYIGIFFTEDVEWTIWIFNFRIIAFDIGSHLPFYVCRLSVLVLLYYVITKDKRVESFLFYWGATGLAGIIYPNGPLSNIANLTETFYIDHFFLGLTPYFLIVYQGFKPNVKNLLIITGVMFVILVAFIPINDLLNTLPNIEVFADYFYVQDQSIVGVIIPGLPSVVFAMIHTAAAFVFFSIYYYIFKNNKYGMNL